MSTDVIKTNAGGVAQFTDSGASLVRAMLCKDASDIELAFFASYCKRLELDPFSGHVHLVKRGSGSDKIARPELSIAGKLLVAERSGKYRGRTPYEWCGEDGAWVEIWLKTEPPRAARVGVYRDGAEKPIIATALWDSYVGQKYGGETNAMWKKHGPRMIAKCALSLALSEALPAELGGVYTIEEMAQADNPVESKRDRAAQMIEGVELLDDSQLACLEAISAACGHPGKDRGDLLAEDYPTHVNTAIQYAVKQGIVDAGSASDVEAAALVLDVDAVQAELAGVTA